MSCGDGWAAINLEMPRRIPRTKHSAQTYWDLIKAVTGPWRSATMLARIALATILTGAVGLSHDPVRAQATEDAAMPAFQMYLTRVGATCVSFLRPAEPDTYLGYRIVEQEPERATRPLRAHASHPKAKPAETPSLESPQAPPVPAGEYTDDWQTAHDAKGVRFATDKDGVAWFEYPEGEGMTRRLTFRAVADGIEMWLELSSESAIPGAYVVQQCFRLSGETNDEWRHHIALVPELSEFDLWAREQPPRSLTFVRQGDAWLQVPPVERGVRYDTPAGVELARMQGAESKATAAIPHGLIVRQAADGSSVVGLFWERTTRVSNHHPADCLHSFVDLGPIEAGGSRTVRGKVYWMAGTKDELLEHWRADFPINQAK